MRELQIISGGQTGADRAGLDAALKHGIPCGGYCPLGRLSEEGTIPEIYPLIENESPDYRKRTEKNVCLSTATLIFSFGDLRGGSLLTKNLCEKHAKPHCHQDASRINVDDSAAQVIDFMDLHGHRCLQFLLNVAGQRLSQEPRIYDFVFEVMDISISHWRSQE